MNTDIPSEPYVYPFVCNYYTYHIAEYIITQWQKLIGLPWPIKSMEI